MNFLLEALKLSLAAEELQHQILSLSKSQIIIVFLIIYFFIINIIISFIGALVAVRDCRQCHPACADLTSDPIVLFHVSTLIVLSTFSVNISGDAVSSIRDRRHSVNNMNSLLMLTDPEVC